MWFYRYINGNYFVTYSSGGLTKRAFRLGENLIADFPDSIDLKISNRCSNNCPFCHENSIPNGKFCNIADTIRVLGQLPNKPIEIAIGGGNIFETPDETLELLRILSNMGFQLRLTVRFEDIIKYLQLNDPTEPIYDIKENKYTNKYYEITDMVGGIGISISKYYNIFNTSSNQDWQFPKRLNKERKITPFEDSEYVSNKFLNDLGYRSRKIVFHVILGLFPLDQLELLLYQSVRVNPILFLGFKQYGRAANMQLPESIKAFEVIIKKYIKFYNSLNFFEKSCYPPLAFDNLAIEQLHLKDESLPIDWDSLYMGDEGQHSMYIDAVEGTFAINSRSDDRVSWNDVGLLDYFKSLRK